MQRKWKVVFAVVAVGLLGAGDHRRRRGVHDQDGAGVAREDLLEVTAFRLEQLNDDYSTAADLAVASVNLKRGGRNQRRDHGSGHDDKRCSRHPAHQEVHREYNQGWVHPRQGCEQHLKNEQPESANQPGDNSLFYTSADLAPLLYHRRLTHSGSISSLRPRD